MTWPSPTILRDYIRSKKRHNESLLVTAHRLVTTIAFQETVAQGMFRDAMADWLDLPGNQASRRTATARLIKRYKLTAPPIKGWSVDSEGK